MLSKVASVADMHHLNADPDPACNFVDADPDPNIQIKAQNLEEVLK